MKASFRVEIAASAEADLRENHDYIARDNPKAAAKWLRDTLAAVRSLRSLPYRCEIVSEAEETGLDLRHLIRGNFRIIYRIDGKRVRVLRVVRASRPLTLRMLLEGPQ